MPTTQTAGDPTTASDPAAGHDTSAVTTTATVPTPTTTPRPTTTPAPTDAATADPTLRTLRTDVALRAASSPLGSVSSDVDLADDRTGAACQRMLSDRQAVTQAQGAVVASQGALDAAEQRENTDEAAGQVSIENAARAS